MFVRPEEPSLYPHIRALLLDTFPEAAEADLVDALRRDGDAEIALVAVDGDDVVGYVLLSRMEAPFRALGLAPAAVLPGRQKQGIGRRLIAAALEAARSADWDGAFVLGDPAYYARFGFDAAAAEGFASPYAGSYFMVLALKPEGLPVRSGRVAYPRAFADLG